MELVPANRFALSTRFLRIAVRFKKSQRIVAGLRIKNAIRFAISACATWFLRFGVAINCVLFLRFKSCDLELRMLPF